MVHCTGGVKEVVHCTGGAPTAYNQTAYSLQPLQQLQSILPVCESGVTMAGVLVEGHYTLYTV